MHEHENDKRSCLVFNAGGSSMSGIARLLHCKGWLVQGYENAPNFRTDELKKNGITMHFGKERDFADYPFDMVVHSSTENADDLRERFSIKHIIPVYTQFALINHLIRGSTSIAVTGSYGKTITTSLVIQMLDAAGINASFTCGGNIIEYGRNSRLGASNYWVVEAVETHANLLHIYPNYAVILNIEGEELIPLFRAFVLQTETLSLINFDDRHCRALIDSLPSDIKFLRMGVDNDDADYQVKDIVTSRDQISFQLVHRLTPIGRISTKFSAAFSVYNLLAASAIAHIVGVPNDSIVSGVTDYKGVSNRFEIRFIDDSRVLITDIAHHPSSISSSIEQCKRLFSGEVIVVYRPHMYSELNVGYSATTWAFELADKVLIRDVLSFKDNRDGGYDSQQFVESQRNKDKWSYLSGDTLPTIRLKGGRRVIIIIMGMYQDEIFTRNAWASLARNCEPKA